MAPVLSIDLHKAFDMVSRKQLANTLAALPGPAEAKAAALRLHTECTYHLRVAGQGAAVHTTRGVRQGCRLAPALWSAVTGDLLRRMTEDPRRGPLGIGASAQGSIPSSFPSRRSPTWALSSPLASRLTALWSTGSRRHDGASANSSVASEAARS